MADIEDMKPIFQDYFKFIKADDQGATLKQILRGMCEEAFWENANMVIIDPWNKVVPEFGKTMKETDYIGECLRELQLKAREFNLSVWVVAHPTKPRRGRDGKWMPVTLYDISGSSHWFSMCDNGFILERTWEMKTSDENLTNMRIAKIKDSRYGKVGEHSFKFEPWCKRYVDTGIR